MPVAAGDGVGPGAAGDGVGPVAAGDGVGPVVVEADGGSRGNPGPAGYGAVVFDAASGDVLAEANEPIGTATNNVAEYRGLIAGLAAARDLGAAQVAVRMDSKLVVEQMKGTWRVKHEGLQPLARQAQALARQFDAITYEWIPRERNGHADRLANEAMDRAAGPATAPPATAPPATAPPATASRSAAAPRSDPPAAARRVSGGSWSPPTDSATRLVLVRHGSTVHSAARKFSGRNDLPLDDNGRAQAAALAGRDFGAVDAIVSSPLPRTVQTAQANADALGLPVETVDDLVETDFGAWEGRTFADVFGSDPEALQRWRGSLDEAPPDGESFTAVGERVDRALAGLVDRFPGRTVVVVSHVTPIKLLLGTALAARESVLFRLHLDTASVSVVDFYADGNASVTLVNDTSHLR